MNRSWDFSSSRNGDEVLLKLTDPSTDLRVDLRVRPEQVADGTWLLAWNADATGPDARVDREAVEEFGRVVRQVKSR